jgi:hypothetical protein
MAAKALAAADSSDAERLSVLLPQAVRFYLGERDSGQPSWRYPSFLDSGTAPAAGDCTVNLDEELWQLLRAEAERQETSPEDLLQHAASITAPLATTVASPSASPAGCNAKKNPNDPRASRRSPASRPASAERSAG